MNKNIDYKKTLSETISQLNIFDYFDKKYYGVSLNENEEQNWKILSDFIIDKSSEFEFGIGIDTTNSHFNDLQITELPPFSREDKVTQFKSMYLQLKQVGLQDNIIQFYSTKRNFLRLYTYDWHLALLKIDDLLKSILKQKKTLTEYVDLTNDNGQFEFYNPAFYGENGTAIMFCIHSEMKAYILLEEEEKKTLEEEGIEFLDEIDRSMVTKSEDGMTREMLEEL